MQKDMVTTKQKDPLLTTRQMGRFLFRGLMETDPAWAAWMLMPAKVDMGRLLFSRLMETDPARAVQMLKAADATD